MPGSGRIVIDLQPGRLPNEYGMDVHYENVDGGWPTIFGLLLAALGIVVNQIAPGTSVGASPVFQAMCGVFKAFLLGLIQAGERGPLIERVAAMPEKLIH